MPTQIIDCKLIDESPTRPGERSFSREFAKNLATSIEMEGLHQPIVVRPNPEKPGRYWLVAGKHRLHAVAKVLKRPQIEASIRSDMDETDADMATVAENLWRNPLKKAQHLLAIQRWHEHYAAKYPHKIGPYRGGSQPSGSAAGRKAARQDEGASAPGDTAPETPRPNSGLGAEESSAVSETPESHAGDVPNFAETVAQTTGQSLSGAKVDVKIALAFTPDQIEVFEQMQVTKTEMHTVARIADAQRRAEVVNLIASGMEVAEAIAQVMQTEAGTAQTGNGSQGAAESGADTPDESQMDDATWLSAYCGEIRKVLPAEGLARFDQDARFYRAVRDLRNAARKKGKKPIERFRSGPRGAFLRAAIRFLYVAHPKDWLRCGACLGHGVKESGGKCPACYGDGYQMKTEIR